MQIKLQGVIFAVQQNIRTMLNIEELSKGNIVQANRRVYRVIAISEVVKISRGDEQDWVNVNIEDLRPLPITPETLALLGFAQADEQDQDGGHKIVFVRGSGYSSIILNWIDGFVVHNGFIFQEIHRLQNYIQAIYGITLTLTKP